MNFKNAAEAAKDYVVEQRRWFHQHPELSWQEFKTTDKIEQELKKMGYDVVRFGDKPGCYADLDTGKPGKTIRLRARSRPHEQRENRWIDPKIGRASCRERV